ncbi:MAG: YkgJ family cysteine cluster protein [Epsilonproteobacteria bacterium]|nr:zinc/iron-chelating domain-containing protein [Campylobacterota bacterium]NPA56511.1 YkgJ family cysteine cluster protein [Campylobacterota bacterium]
MQTPVKREGFPFAFDPGACLLCMDRCCRGERGYVWVGRGEIEEISRYLGMETRELIEGYLRKVGYRWSLKEVKSQGEYLCIFLAEGGRGCTIYPVRPKQCREYPFWDRYRDPEHISEVCKECRGIILDS